MTSYRFAAQPGGVEVARGEAEIVVRFPLANAYGDQLAEAAVSVELDSATARHLAALLTAIVPTDEAELLDTIEQIPVKLPRTGGSPIKFTGRRLASASSRRWPNGGALETRWHEMAIYARRGGGFVLAVTYMTCWQDEHRRDDVCNCPDGDAVAKVLADYDPTWGVAGFPDSDRHAEKQERLLETIRRGYESAVSTVLDQAGIEEVM